MTAKNPESSFLPQFQHKFKVGDRVRVEGHSQIGTITELWDDNEWVKRNPQYKGLDKYAIRFPGGQSASRYGSDLTLVEPESNPESTLLSQFQHKFKVGDRVRVEGHSQIGTITELWDDNEWVKRNPQYKGLDKYEIRFPYGQSASRYGSDLTLVNAY
jgi:putative ribosome biogenesis GTPase RsgA